VQAKLPSKLLSLLLSNSSQSLTTELRDLRLSHLQPEAARLHQRQHRPHLRVFRREHLGGEDKRSLVSLRPVRHQRLAVLRIDGWSQQVLQDERGSRLLTEKFTTAQQFLENYKPPYFESYTIVITKDQPCFGKSSIWQVTLVNLALICLMLFGMV